ncbi:MAG TPA: endonuclease/exonuclease/phosphatase [Ferruginibacter sp.]|nr:endonuclease/exonuclease/phosphatase [Ferruginibacter sp.]HMP20420.1 endonuclease/exonuclease/phosphatase [Ferruginibacter sp.]
MKQFFILFFVLFTAISATAQKASYKVSLIGFYNLENLYDTINDPNVNDEEFLPGSERNYHSGVYWDKIGRLADVLSQIGTDITPDGLAMVGVAEVENEAVLQDLVNHTLLKKRKWKVVHYNSPDLRGVDVGFLYNPKYFTVLESRPYFVQLPGGAKDSYLTRDVLYVKGVMDGDTVFVFVNHWPSRRGGEERSAPGRAAAASVVKARIDSVQAINPNYKIVVMGDLNDDPISPSVTKVLGAKGKKEDVKPTGLFNPFTEFYKKGIGTSPYNDAWGLFDQVIVSGNWLTKEQQGYHYAKAVIFNKEFMIQQTGRWKGYSKRTWDGITYNYGYSDHFPVYLVTLKKME